ncbi:uncharacterized protein LOC129219220 [Uloborus diversus]|uniref:uncharacterized protein LOC129219220 n=1 Tax=Uloborus diversus TaxID=327109 RepID=UPI002408F93D|nr:uncharacterized protein LOC129219220 [Uloborus diversus]
MRFISVPMLLVVVGAMLWLSFLVDASSETTTKSNTEVSGRRFLSLGPFRPFMRVLGMMGIPLLPLLLLRQLIVTGAASNAQASGGGAGLGSMGALGILGPFGAGAGLGGLRPTGGIAAAAGGGGGGLRPLGLRPFAGRPLSNLIANAAGAGAAGATAGAGADALFLRKRSTEHEKGSSRFSSLMSALAKLEQVVDHYDLSVPDCQRRFVCELHRKSLNPSFGSLTEKLIQAFGVEARLEKSHFSSNTKSVLKDFLKAARNGLQQRECAAIYYKCPVAVTEKEEKEEKVEKNGKKETSPATENMKN